MRRKANSIRRREREAPPREMFSPHLEEREALSKKKGYPSYLSKEG
ncbi:hypothetical protein POREN0001_1342 [Porphyromonas endodontalis ATCC 35406]|uniref:Uncharacterized protein n=1 Tax=Porphyromonas endodontalis (strain ATCC 35406 / DSM 24491 / JCM 8526 / CCUG 16442 / BCRC 14492 / NCTC 13058 / HG 370) TaxID=553175 RepID=C3J898_POREA|nr:hypothetical protein POREN0001_1342 [Porphyromonas endodontalis ATCC 35406]